MIRPVYILFTCLIVFCFACKEAPTFSESTDGIETPESKAVLPERPKEIDVLDLTDDVALFIVVAGAYSSERGAKKKVDGLIEAGFTNAGVIQRPGSKLYSALVERFDTEAAAEKFAEQIATNNEIKSYVYKLDD